MSKAPTPGAAFGVDAVPVKAPPSQAAAFGVDALAAKAQAAPPPVPLPPPKPVATPPPMRPDPSLPRDLQPSEWFRGKMQEWQKDLQSWHVRQMEWKNLGGPN